MSDWLGIDEVLRASWSNDRRETMTLAEVHELLGRHPRRLVGELVDVGLLVREDDGSFVAPSRGLLELTRAHARRGREHRHRRAAPPTSCAGGSRRRPTTSSSCSRRRRVARSRARARADEVAAALDVLRPIALDAAQLILAQELERSLRALATRGVRTGKRR